MLLADNEAEAASAAAQPQEEQLAAAVMGIMLESSMMERGVH
jgi:hypothetical protein